MAIFICLNPHPREKFGFILIKLETRRIGLALTMLIPSPASSSALAQERGQCGYPVVVRAEPALIGGPAFAVGDYQGQSQHVDSALR